MRGLVHRISSWFVQMWAVLGSALVVTAAAAAPVYLSCEYPADLGVANAEQLKAIPRSLSIDYETGTVTWNANAATAAVSDTQINFAHSGFQYSISRVSGEIRFFSPQGLADWKKYEKAMIDGDVMRGIPLAEAQIRAANASRTRGFMFREHAGKCIVATERRF